MNQMILREGMADLVLLALDQSSRVTGYAIFEDENLIDCGKFELQEDNFGKRLFHFKKQIINLIDKYNIDEVAFEDIYQDDNKINNVQTFKKLSEVYGVLSELLTEIDIPHQSFLAVEWKPTVGIKGGKRPEQKRLAQSFILNKYNKKVTQDEADAICIGIHYLQKQKNKDFDWSE